MSKRELLWRVQQETLQLDTGSYFSLKLPYLPVRLTYSTYSMGFGNTGLGCSHFSFSLWTFHGAILISVCVCEREKESEREREKACRLHYYFNGKNVLFSLLLGNKKTRFSSECMAWGI